MSKEKAIKAPKPGETKGYPGSNPPKPQTGRPSTPPPKQPIKGPKK